MGEEVAGVVVSCTIVNGFGFGAIPCSKEEDGCRIPSSA